MAVLDCSVGLLNARFTGVSGNNHHTYDAYCETRVLCITFTPTALDYKKINYIILQANPSYAVLGDLYRLFF